jgi:micrococcal nuclease
VRFVGRSILLLVTVALPTVAARAAETIRGPIEGSVARVIDGDTLEFVAHVWLGLSLTTHVRVRGIDTPEVRGACPREKEMAAQATAYLNALTGAGVTVANVSDDKYFGRVIADVITTSGADVRTAMIASGLARPYDGGASQSWCVVAATGG